MYQLRRWSHATLKNWFLSKIYPCLQLSGLFEGTCLAIKLILKIIFPRACTFKNFHKQLFLVMHLTTKEVLHWCDDHTMILFYIKPNGNDTIIWTFKMFIMDRVVGWCILYIIPPKIYYIFIYIYIIIYCTSKNMKPEKELRGF